VNLDEQGFVYTRHLPEKGLWAAVVPLTFGRGRVVACAIWGGDGEPEGWMRHPQSGRRRPGGDASQEYLQR
jgi:hypothetical protein